MTNRNYDIDHETEIEDKKRWINDLLNTMNIHQLRFIHKISKHVKEYISFFNIIKEHSEK